MDGEATMGRCGQSGGFTAAPGVRQLWRWLLLLSSIFGYCFAASAHAESLVDRLRGCLLIEDMTKERLDCYDAIVPPQPKPRPPVAKTITDCKFLKEEDERLICYNRFLERPLRPAPPKVTAAAPKVNAASLITRPSTQKSYVRRGRGGCGSRGGAGYRLPNGKCASRKR